MNDLYERLRKASVQLREMAQDRSRSLLEQARPFGKAEGVRLAMSYLDEDKTFEKLLEISIGITDILANRVKRDDKLVNALLDLANEMSESSASGHPNCAYDEDCVACSADGIVKIINEYTETK